MADYYEQNSISRPRMITVSAPRDLREPEPEAEAPTADDRAEKARLNEIMEREKKSELERLRSEYLRQGRQALADANEKAKSIIEATKKDAEKVYIEANEQAEKLKAEQSEKGYAEGLQKGLTEGETRGYDEGYKKGLTKCKEAMLELKAGLENISAEKEKTVKSLERGLFDTIFEIAQKITLDSLKQKDKAVLQKMIKDAAKGFRGSELVKITISELDLSADAEVELSSIEKVLSGFSHIEFEVKPDAPSGTVIVDNGKEIVDASVSTQLKMIEELGRGKYRDRAPAEGEADEPLPDIIEEPPAPKPKKPRAKKPTNPALSVPADKTEGE